MSKCKYGFYTCEFIGQSSFCDICETGDNYQMKQDQFGRGGKREGSGRPRQFEQPAIINFKCEAKEKERVKKKYGSELNKMFNDWLKSI